MRDKYAEKIVIFLWLIFKVLILVAWIMVFAIKQMIIGIGIINVQVSKASLNFKKQAKLSMPYVLERLDLKHKYSIKNHLELQLALFITNFSLMNSKFCVIDAFFNEYLVESKVMKF